METRFLLGIALFAVLATAVFAAEDASDASLTNPAGNLMSSALAEAKCRVDFVLAVLKAAAAEEIHAQYMTTLTDDITHLEQYAQANNLHAFNGYRGSTYVDHMKDAWNAVRQAKANRNWTAAEKETLRSEYVAAHNAYNTCSAGASSEFAKAKISRYEYIISNYEQKTQQLKGKIDTSGLATVIANAKQQILEPLRTTVSSGAATPHGIREAVGRYCIMDGCEGGTNFHLQEKYEIEKLNSVIGQLSLKANKADLGEDKAKNVRDTLAQASEHIENAKAAVENAGGNPLTQEQKTAIRDSLRLASGLAKQVLGVVRAD